MLPLLHLVEALLNFTKCIGQFLVVFEGMGELLDDMQQLYPGMVGCSIINVGDGQALLCVSCL